MQLCNVNMNVIPLEVLIIKDVILCRVCSDATMLLCFAPAGWWTLLLSRPGEGEGQLPRCFIHLQWPAVSEQLPLVLAVCPCSDWLNIDCLLSPLPLSLPCSGMFDDGLHMYLIEPLQQTHLSVSYSHHKEPQCWSPLLLIMYLGPSSSIRWNVFLGNSCKASQSKKNSLLGLEWGFWGRM